MATLSSRNKSAALIKRHGWTKDFADGYVDAEAHRRRGKHPSNLILVAHDDYSLGFRAGYFERGKPAAQQPEATAKGKP